MQGFDLSTIQDVYVGGTGFSYIYYGSNVVWQKSAPIHYDEMYLTLEALEPGTFGITIKSGTNPAPTYYSLDDGTTWNEFISGNNVSVTTGDKMLLKRDVSAGTYSYLDNTILTSTANFNVYGNSQSMIYSDNFIGTTDFNHMSCVFSGLFKDNTHLIDASNLILPVMLMQQTCYTNMFYGCTSLTAAPELPATTMGLGCYTNMFYGCTSLTTAPELPATDLSIHMSDGCYMSMFEGCTSLTTAPELPATLLKDDCYNNMFHGCTSLTTAPELPATTLRNNCYQGMFSGCTSLNYIKCLATNISASNCTTNWVNGVAEYGTFISADNMTGWTIGSSGIPTNWLAPKMYENQYLTIESLEDDNDMYWMYHNDSSSDYRQSIEYSYNNGTWITNLSNTSQLESNKFLTMQKGDKIRIKATHHGYSNYKTLSWNYFKPLKTVKIYGNIMSLLYGDNFVGQTTIEGSDNWAVQYKFSHMFSDTNITDVSKLVLPATSFGETTAVYPVYGYMFYGNTSIRIAPELPAINISQKCYEYMFDGCSNLQYVNCSASAINATYCDTWLLGVNSTGTFVTHNNPTYIRGDSGIPSGWQVIDN